MIVRAKQPHSNDRNSIQGAKQKQEDETDGGITDSSSGANDTVERTGQRVVPRGRPGVREWGRTGRAMRSSVCTERLFQPRGVPGGSAKPESSQPAMSSVVTLNDTHPAGGWDAGRSRASRPAHPNPNRSEPETGEGGRHTPATLEAQKPAAAAHWLCCSGLETLPRR